LQASPQFFSFFPSPFSSSARFLLIPLSRSLHPNPPPLLALYISVLFCSVPLRSNFSTTNKNSAQIEDEFRVLFRFLVPRFCVVEDKLVLAKSVTKPFSITLPP
jgi:hypothetical protein